MKMPPPTADADFVRDNDSLYVMPLRIVPFSTPALKQGRLIKNAILKPAIEIYNSTKGGSGQILIEDITPDLGRNYFGWQGIEVHPDMVTLKKLAQLTSYDVYSLRILFRKLGIATVSNDYLELSEQKKTELNSYMQAFTQPLVKHIYGDSVGEDLDSPDIIKLFSAPDTERATRNLLSLADLLNMPVRSIPSFLEDFADIFLSLSYYQQHLDDIVPKMIDLVAEINAMQESWQIRQDRNFRRICRELVTNLNDITARVTGRFESFQRSTEGMWEKISAERFHETEKLIRGHHTAIGGVLCSLGIKMNVWKKHFPSRQTGSPMARAELIQSSIHPGMEQVMKLG